MKTMLPKNLWVRKFLLGTALLIVACILYNISAVWAGVQTLFGFLQPFLMGGAIAFVLNIPMDFFERHIFQGKRFQSPKWDKLRRGLSLVLTILAALLLIAVILLVLVPQLTASVRQVFNKDNFFRIIEWIETNLNQYPFIEEKLLEIATSWQSQISSLLGTFSERLQDLVGTGFRVVGGVVTGITNFVIGLVFAIYLLLDKARLGMQCRRILLAFLPERLYRKSLEITRLSYQTFSDFISGQCLDAMILGVMFFITMLLLQMPYALLVSVIIAVFALIPVVGAFIACGIGMIFIGLDTPAKALIFLGVFLVLQQIDNNLIYPRIVGGSVGLPGMWVLFAITIGGAMWGATGMLIGIPLMSVLYTLLGQLTRSRLRKKGIAPDFAGDESGVPQKLPSVSPAAPPEQSPAQSPAAVPSLPKTNRGKSGKTKGKSDRK